MNKYHARRTYSNLCQREFASKWEAERAEQLRSMELAGEIKDLGYQVKFVLCEKPKITVSIDFVYWDYAYQPSRLTYEDAKGVLTRDSRTKYAWLKEKHGIVVKLMRRGQPHCKSRITTGA